MVNVVIPYSTDRNLGAAYNRALSLQPENQWVCLLDHDVLMLTPDCIAHIDEYTKRFPGAGILTCYTNRLHPASKGQLYGAISENSDIREHIEIAEQRKRDLYQVEALNHPIGGFMMVVNTSVWEGVKFTENKKCLGVDNDFSERILRWGRNILLMKGIYVWHTYRLIDGYRSKKHLL